MDTTINQRDIDALAHRVRRQRLIDADLRQIAGLPPDTTEYSLVVELLSICDLYARNEQAKLIRAKATNGATQ